MEWTPEGPCAYNPYARGSDTELADKLLAGETWTEPHYLRQAQRCLRWVVEAVRGAGLQLDLATIVEHFAVADLELLSRHMNGRGSHLQRYLDSWKAAASGMGPFRRTTTLSLMRIPELPLRPEVEAFLVEGAGSRLGWLEEVVSQQLPWALVRPTRRDVILGRRSADPPPCGRVARGVADAHPPAAGRRADLHAG